jgi:hypothetical protein
MGRKPHLVVDHVDFAVFGLHELRAARDRGVAPRHQPSKVVEEVRDGH